MVARMSFAYAHAPGAQATVAWVGALTALFAASVALVQKDIKRVLAWSTISQLGYMFLAVGSGAYVAAIFHMITHAFFKALLFLGSGSVIHGMHDEQDMRRMGQLRKWMPVTWITFMVGWLAIAGVPPFAGFWSKDEILLYAFSKHPALYALGLLTALLTAYYMTRQVIMVFYGDERWNAQLEPGMADTDHGHGDGHDAPAVQGFVGSASAHVHGPPHESSVLMLIPLVVLAGLSAVGGVLQLPFGKSVHFLEKWLHPVVGEREAHLTSAAESAKWGLLVVAVVVAVAGIVAAYLVYERKRVAAIEPPILAHGWYYDETLAKVMGGPGEQAFEGLATVDSRGVDGAVNGVARLLVLAGGQLRKLQTGYVRSYAAGVGVGAVLLLAWFVVRGMF
jgi:NADH-quinone oxidoreductase subunit L